MDPFARLFCVRYDRSPEMDYYWIQNNSNSPEVLDSVNFSESILGETQSAEKNAKGHDFYDLGDKMKASIKTDD